MTGTDLPDAVGRPADCPHGSFTLGANRCATCQPLPDLPEPPHCETCTCGKVTIHVTNPPPPVIVVVQPPHEPWLRR